ncbi:MAG: NAD(+) diphosphatase [Allosphingosinicella sp.]|uniref:NAD(+) diphosphatase n=1 Tax=Allosphingosinicella sp. TaxID=2823234 RepID=UPI00393ADF82
MIPPGFTGAGLDRADQLRVDAARLAEALAHAEASVLAMQGLEPELDEASRLVWSPINGHAIERLILLGFDGEVPRFAPIADVAPHGTAAMYLFKLISELDAREAAIWAAARSLNEWHARHRFCGVCGTPTEPFRAGWGRRCGGCGAENFPRVDPVVIMLAEHDGRVLVGRQHRYPPGRYSALAGFLEPGESIEEAVARELFEEAGLRVGAVRYVTSQPWPFPYSLMMACMAEAEDDSLTLDTTEIEAAFWVDRAGVRAALDAAPDAPFQAPPPYAIAHTLLRWWVEQED